VLTDAVESIAWLQRAEGGCCAFVGDAVVKDDLIGIAIRKNDDDLRAKRSRRGRKGKDGEEAVTTNGDITQYNNGIVDPEAAEKKAREA